ncbi:MAG TPA: acetoacetate--CoA ligase [Polyangiaceae bacterium]|nr:acetoacetate--CoA ligase [Polyangiaceae bacterium]
MTEAAGRAALWEPSSLLGPEPGQLLWQPTAEQCAESRIRHYMAWLTAYRGVSPRTYDELWRWSTQNLPEFWRSMVDYFEVQLHQPARSIVGKGEMPGVHWFEGATLNYAERALSHPPEHIALLARREDGTREQLTYAELSQRVASVAQGFANLGVTVGDRIAGYLPNDVQAVVAFLACASLGAIWSSCPPEFGVESVLDRFQQIEPKLLVAVTGYRYGGKYFDRAQALQRIASGLPSLLATVITSEAMPAGEPAVPGPVVSWASLLKGEPSLQIRPMPFEHPLWILYSSGTTGLPKALVQGHGGIVLEHLKMLALHGDIGANSRFFWFSTTGWMMWNYLVSGLLVGATVVLYDGSPAHPDLNALWQLAAEEKITHFGVSAAFILACRKGGLEPQKFDLSQLQNIGSTGSPLPLEGFEWVYRNVKRDVLLGSISGGTDLCTAFVGQCPVLPVRAGELQCRSLGAAVEAWNDRAQALVGEVGELVITKPMPSMPLYFWGDPNGQRYQQSYFEMFPGVWRHGDWIRIDPSGSCVIYGRSDSTLNRGGVRMGTSEFYRVVEGIDEIVDSVVIDSSELGHEGKLWLLVVLPQGQHLDANLKGKIVKELRNRISPRHVPDEIRQIEQVPRTLSGKKLEVPLKRVLAGVPLEKAVNPGTLQNPQALRSVLAALDVTPDPP